MYTHWCAHLGKVKNQRKTNIKKCFCHLATVKKKNIVLIYIFHLPQKEKLTFGLLGFITSEYLVFKCRKTTFLLLKSPDVRAYSYFGSCLWPRKFEPASSSTEEEIYLSSHSLRQAGITALAIPPVNAGLFSTEKFTGRMPGDIQILSQVL